MADYTTYATLLNENPANDLNTDGLGFHDDDEETYIVCDSSSAEFEKLLKFFDLKESEIKTSVKKVMLKGLFWREFGDEDHDISEDFPLSEINWLNSTCTEWTGTDEQYEAYLNGLQGSMYESKTYGTMQEEYPKFNAEQHTYEIVETAFIFKSHWTGNPKAFDWINMYPLGSGLSGIILAKDAAKHLDLSDCTNQDEFKWKDSLITDAENFAEKHGEKIAVIFPFG